MWGALYYLIRIDRMIFLVKNLNFRVVGCDIMLESQKHCQFEKNAYELPEWFLVLLRNTWGAFWPSEQEIHKKFLRNSWEKHGAPANMSNSLTW